MYYFNFEDLMEAVMYGELTEDEAEEIAISILADDDEF